MDRTHQSDCTGEEQDEDLDKEEQEKEINRVPKLIEISFQEGLQFLTACATSTVESAPDICLDFQMLQ